MYNCCEGGRTNGETPSCSGGNGQCLKLKGDKTVERVCPKVKRETSRYPLPDDANLNNV